MLVYSENKTNPYRLVEHQIYSNSISDCKLICKIKISISCLIGSGDPQLLALPAFLPGVPLSCAVLIPLSRAGRVGGPPISCLNEEKVVEMLLGSPCF